jgi:hypothetical protein
MNGRGRQFEAAAAGGFRRAGIDGCYLMALADQFGEHRHGKLRRSHEGDAQPKDLLTRSLEKMMGREVDPWLPNPSPAWEKLARQKPGWMKD